MAKISKYGVDWKNHLPFVSSCHEDLSIANATFISTLGGSMTDLEGNVIYKEDAYNRLRGYLAKFFNIVRPLFGPYLEDKKFKEDWEGYTLKVDCARDYELLIEDYKAEHIARAVDAAKVILFWANKHGPFATFVSETNYKTDEDYLESRE